MTDIIRRDPFQDVARFWPRAFGRDWIGHLSGRFPEFGDWVPTCDVSQQNDAIVIDVELPGVDAKDIEVALDGDVLTIRGEKRTETKDKKDGRAYTERSFGCFERLVNIPGGADPAAVDAALKDGVLHVRVPRKVPAASEPARIEVHTE